MNPGARLAETPPSTSSKGLGLRAPWPWRACCLRRWRPAGRGPGWRAGRSKRHQTRPRYAGHHRSLACRSASYRVPLIRFDAYHAGLGVQAACLLQGLCPCCHQTAHAGFGNPVCVFGQRAGGYHVACGIEHAHGVGAPGAAQAGHHVQGLGKSGVAHCGVLRSSIKAAVALQRCWCGLQARSLFFKTVALVPRLHQGAGACHAGHTGADETAMRRGVGAVRGARGRVAARAGLGRGMFRPFGQVSVRWVV